MAVPTAPTLRRGPVFFSSADLVLQRNEEKRQRDSWRRAPNSDATEEPESDDSSFFAAPPPRRPLSTASKSLYASLRETAAATVMPPPPSWALHMTPAAGGLIDDEDGDSYRSTSTFNPLHARHMQWHKAPGYRAQEQALYEAAVPLRRAGLPTTFTPTQIQDSQVMPLPQWRAAAAGAAAAGGGGASPPPAPHHHHPHHPHHPRPCNRMSQAL